MRGRLYSRGSIQRESDLGYHRLLRDFLVSAVLAHRGDRVLQRAPALHDLSDDAAAVEVLARTLRPNRIGKLPFRLSKISRISIRVTRGTSSVATINPGVLGRGTETLAWKAPKRSGDYGVMVTATDLAGNAASAAAGVGVEKRP